MTQNRRALVIAVVAVVVVVLGLVLVAVLFSRRGDAPDATSVPTSPPVASGRPTTAASTPDSGLPVPAVVASPIVGGVDFTWSYSGAQPNDTFLVHVGTSAEDAQIADPITRPRAAYSVKVRSGSPACLIAVVVRSGETSAASPAVCGTAR